jgi:4-hydroxy-2-oxoheptanedioate aldolase
MGPIVAGKGLKPVKAEDFANHGMAAYRASSLFQLHRLREAIKDAYDGKIPPLMGYFMGFPSPAVAKVVALFGFDLAWIDWEHTAMNVETMTQVILLNYILQRQADDAFQMVHDIQLCSEGKTAALVR